MINEYLEEGCVYCGKKTVRITKQLKRVIHISNCRNQEYLICDSCKKYSMRLVDDNSD